MAQIFLLVFLIVYVLKASGLNIIKPLPEVKFKSEFEYFKSCPADKSDKQIFFMDYTKDEINANWTVLESFDETYAVKVEVYDWDEKDQEWQKSKAFARNDACNTMYKIFDPKWTHIMTAVGNPNGCPIKPGNYVLNHYKDLDQSNKPISSTSMMKAGRYKIFVKAIKDLNSHICAEMVITLTELNSKKTLG